METEMINKVERINIPKDAKVKVYWDDQPMNYSKEGKNKIKTFFAKKYGINKDNINVVYRPVKFNDKGDVIEIVGAGIDNIMDIGYQRSLMKEVILRDNKIVDFDRIIALDNKVNGELNIDLTVSQHRSWSIKWIMVDNFLSFGSDNFASFSKMKGLTVVNSTPANQGGKTTFTIDAPKFLLHGNTTKTDTNSEIFNTYSGKNEVVIRGMIDIEGDELIIERKLKRSQKKTGDWTVINKVNYYEILPDGEERELTEEDAIRTTKKIKETIGSEKDFELLVLSTSDSLDDLIGLTTSESGKLLTRLIGLEILELKEAAVRKMYNEFNSKKKSNEFDNITLANEILEHQSKIVEFIEINDSFKIKLVETKVDILRLSSENDRLLNSKEKVDVTISTLNPTKLNGEIDMLISSGKNLKERVGVINENIIKIGDVIFNEDRYHELSVMLSKNTSESAVKKAELLRLRNVIDALISGGMCQTCNRKLDDVDNTEHIKTHEKQIDVLIKEIEEITNLILSINSELSELGKTKLFIDEKNKLELNKDRLEVEMGSLRNQIVIKKIDLTKYNDNLNAIEFNRKVDIDVSQVKTSISVCEHRKDEITGKISKLNLDIESNSGNIVTKNKLIEIIKKEEEVDKIFKVYIELVGKKGISKLVLRSVLPIINSELQRLLEDVCDFEIEIFMDDKNEVQILIIKDDVTKKLKSASGFEKTASSLALRCVLGKISTLPMPNFITFDEVLGKVSAENIDKIKPLFDKIKNMYDIVFLISHNDLVKDFGDNIVTIVKENNLSRISVK